MIDRKRFFKVLSRVRRDGKRVSESLEKDISRDDVRSCWYAEVLLEEGIGVPERILKSVLYSGSRSSYDLANRYLSLGKRVPECLVHSISLNRESSLRYALKLLKMGREVPDCILKSISKDCYCSFQYLVGILNEGEREVPKLILDTVFRSRGARIACAAVCAKMEKEVPEFILRKIGGFRDSSTEFVKSVILNKLSTKLIPKYILDNSNFAGKSFREVRKMVLRGFSG